MTEAMAQLSSLVKAIADVEGLDETRVAWVARHCREAGLISQGGRGRGAAKMEARDAANLLIAVNASDGGKESYQSIALYRQLSAVKSHYDQEVWNSITNDGINPPFGFLSKADLRFGQAFDHLIRLCIPEADKPSAFEDALNGSNEDFTITFSRPRPLVSMSVVVLLDEEDDEPLHSEILRTDFGRVISQRDDIPPPKDRTEIVEITGRTLIAAGKALSI